MIYESYLYYHNVYILMIFYFNIQIQIFINAKDNLLIIKLFTEQELRELIETPIPFYTHCRRFQLTDGRNCLIALRFSYTSNGLSSSKER
jgi:hypothetical protein